MKIVLCIAVIGLNYAVGQTIGSIYIHETNPISVTTSPGAGFGNLYVTVVDTNGNYVQNATVTYSAPASGPSSTFPNPSVITTSQGITGTGPLANGVAGTYRITATAGSVSSTFRVANINSKPATGPCVVTSPGDDDTPGTLRSQTATCGSNGVITFAPDLTTVTLDGYEIPIITKLTIDGGSKVQISGNNASRIFFVSIGNCGYGCITTGDLTLQNMTLADGLAKGGNGGSGSGGGGGGGPGLGGAIHLAHGTLTLKTVVFSNNVAQGGKGGSGAGAGSINGWGGGGGGALANGDNSTFTIDLKTKQLTPIAGNGGSNGAISGTGSDGSGASGGGANMTGSGGGGAASLSNTPGNGSYFGGNGLGTTGGGGGGLGGAIYVAGISGGLGVEVYGTYLVLDGVTFTENLANAGTGGNPGYGKGGALFIGQGDSTTATNYGPITFQSNKASDAGASKTCSAVFGNPAALDTNDLCGVFTNAPDLTIAMSHSGNFIQGQTGSYTITASNIGPAATTSSVGVTDTPPNGLSIVSMSGTGWTCGTNVVWYCTRSDTLPSGGSFPPIAVTVDVAKNAPSTVVNTAMVSGDDSAVQGNNTVTDQTTILAAAPSWTITKKHTGDLTQGQTAAIYTITATNAGNAATSGLVTVGESLPTGLSLVSMTGSGWNCIAAACTRNDALPPGLAYPAVMVTVNVAQNAPVLLVNQASISGGGAATANANDPTNVGPAHQVNRHPIRDFRGIGRSDALLYDPVTGVAYTALSNGDGSYHYVGESFTPGFDILRTGDFNGDGKADLVEYNSHTALAYIGMSNGDGTFAFQSLFWSPGYDFVEPGDLNSDGITDFVLYNSSTGTMYTAISNGNGTFTYKYTLISRSFTFVRLADFTGDGKADLFVYNATNGAAFLGIGDGAGGFSFQALFISAGYNLVDVGDLNGDGKADVILYNSQNGNAAAGISNGAGGFSFSPMIFSPGFTSVRLGDYTGDGKADLTVYNKTNASAYFGIGTGTGTFNFQSLFWSPAYDDVEPQDVDGDGKDDVILYNAATGTEYTGLSNGAGGFTNVYSLWGPGKMLVR